VCYELVFESGNGNIDRSGKEFLENMINIDRSGKKNLKI